MHASLLALVFHPFGHAIYNKIAIADGFSLLMTQKKIDKDKGTPDHSHRQHHAFNVIRISKGLLSSIQYSLLLWGVTAQSTWLRLQIQEYFEVNMKANIAIVSHTKKKYIYIYIYIYYIGVLLCTAVHMPDTICLCSSPPESFKEVLQNYLLELLLSPNSLQP